MTLRRTITTLALGASVLLATGASAFAAQAVATGNVNVRSGPSTSYARVDTLQRNQLVEVTGCRGGWCYVEKRGADGWVSANYLQQVQVRSPKPSVSFSINFGTTPTIRPPRPHQNNSHWNSGHNGSHYGNHNGGRGNHRDNGPNRGGHSGYNFQFGR